jgi:23S rRNA pseudouridine1911/1915/1917 synthase
MQHSPLHTTLTAEQQGLRLDQALALVFKDYSRSRLKEWILGGHVLVNGQVAQRPRDQVAEGDQITVHVVETIMTDWQPTTEAFALDIIDEDENLLVINKPAGLVVHPGAGNRQGTLVNMLLHARPALNQVPRGGIVHRLDKDTTGLMVVAKTLTAHTALVAALQARQVKRVYEAVVNGTPISGGTIDLPIGRHPHDRKRMAVVESGRPAQTHYRIIQRFKGYTHIRLQLETGRTHQIRVHMAHSRYPLVGDTTYGKRLSHEALRFFKRQALHACQLALIHPLTQVPMEWAVPLPKDMQDLLNHLKYF